MTNRQHDLFEEEYEDFVNRIWLGAPELSEENSQLNFIALAICEEAGEVAGKLKKRSRGDTGITNEMIINELGDTLYYITKLAGELGYDLEDVIRENRKKLTDRLNRNALRGSGDNR